MSDTQENKASLGNDSPGAVVARPDRPAGKLRKNQGLGRNLPATREPQPRAPAEPIARPVPLADNAAQYSQILLDIQRARKRRFLLRLGLFVGLPTLVTFLYTFFWAAPRYVSEFEVTYQTYQPIKSLSAGLVESVLGSSQGSNIDIGAIVYEYVRSEALLSKLSTKLNLRGYYSNPKIDYFSRLATNASSEKLLSYYHRHVAVSEGLGGYLTIDVTAFDPQYALALANAVDRACDEMVDNMTARARQDEVRFAQAELTRQEERVRRARKALTDFQNTHGDLDPQRMATQLGQIVSNLESQLATARAELADALSSMRPDSPRVVQIKYMIAALEKQLHEQQARLANTGGRTPYSQILDQYSALQLEEDFATKAYSAAEQGLALARSDAARQQNYLIDFAPPSAPDKATQSFPLVYTTTAFVVSLLAFGIGSLMVGAFRDQAGL